MENNDYQDMRFLLGEHAEQIIAATAPPSLRDQFAMAALTGVFASRRKDELDPWGDPDFYTWAAQRAYKAADAMMNARAPQAPPSEPEVAFV